LADVKSIFLAISLILLPWTVDAQQYGTGSRKAMKLYEKAVVLVRQMDRQGAEEALLKAIRADHEFLEAFQLLAQVCYEEGRMEEAIAHYSRTLEIDPEWNPEAYRLLAGMEYLTGDYQRGLELLNRYFSYPPARLKNIQGGEVLREKCRFALAALEHPVPFSPENLGDSVNSDLSEYWPCLSVDESTLMFTVMLPLKGEPDGGPASYQEDFFLSHRSNGAWSGRENAGRPLNTMDNEGAHSLTADGRYLFFTACNRREGRGRCDIYMSERGEGNWTPPVNLDPPVNTASGDRNGPVQAGRHPSTWETR
jgi:tetratricopeptide (TPR) repeat protein